MTDPCRPTELIWWRWSYDGCFTGGECCTAITVDQCFPLHTWAHSNCDLHNMEPLYTCIWMGKRITKSHSSWGTVENWELLGGQGSQFSWGKPQSGYPCISSWCYMHAYKNSIKLTQWLRDRGRRRGVWKEKKARDEGGIPCFHSDLTSL